MMAVGGSQQRRARHPLPLATDSRLVGLLGPLGVAALALAVWFGPTTPNFALAGVSGSPDGLIQSDIGLYFGYAERIAEGGIPYGDYFFEYPPLSIPAVALPYVTGDELASYRDGFFALFGAIAAATAVAVLLAARAAGWNAGTQLAAGGLVALAPLMLGHELAPSRLDLLAVLLVALATLAAARRRDGWAGALAGLGAAVKLWPVVMLVPLAVLALRRSGRPALTRSAGAFAAGLCVPFALAVAVSPAGVADSLRFQGDRPLQVEAVGASGLLLLRQLGVSGIESEGSFESRSVNLVGDPADVVAALTTVLGLAAVIALLVIGARRVLDARHDADAFATAMLTALAATAAGLAFAKVLSPQFVLWLVPMPLLVGGRLRWVAGVSVAAILLLTNAAFAGVEAYQNEYESGATAVYVARALALIAFAGALALALWRRPASSRAQAIAGVAEHGIEPRGDGGHRLPPR